MRKLVILLGAVFALSWVGGLAAPSPSFAICNDICQSRCKETWQKFGFKSEAECVRIWSRRNGPSGFGCGKPGAPYQACN